MFFATPAPSVLGFYGLAIATFIGAVGLARGRLVFTNQDYVSSAAIFFFGIAVLLCAAWAYRVRDSLSTAIFGVWGSFFLGFGFLFLPGLRLETITTVVMQSVPLGFWFVAMAVVTWTMAVAAIMVSYVIFAVLVLLGFGAAIAAVGFFSGIPWVLAASGWVMILSSLAALWTASSLLYEAVMGYSPLPLFRREAVPAERHAGERITIEH